jgi:hypothetical protein
VCQVIASDSMYLVLYYFFMLLVTYTCYSYPNCFVVLFCLIFGQRLCFAIMCMLVKACVQFGCIFVRINSEVIKLNMGQIKGNQICLRMQFKFKARNL